ncbi:Cysteine-rich protein 2-binding protein [Papilio machaon]|uniref:Cysteine-rich protein 2-binding protein n=1 Tax=Papilio machaon TaxID=76193 RepID=A0A0N1IQN2_PAPMA|nr:Cysteine-rich protein 2-binding protein [Papilio machaon]
MGRVDRCNTTTTQKTDVKWNYACIGTGWGTLFPGGPTSNVLQKVDLDVISQMTCRRSEPLLTPRQMCTYTPGKDSCQYLLDNLSGTVVSQQRGAALVSRWEAAPFRSSYSGVLLRPYIRRDNSVRPLWLRLTDELLVKTHRQELGYVPPAPASLDYCYVRPQHIAPVNALLAQFFWPGIDS